MSDELMDRVREADPLPNGSSAPPFNVALARVRSAGESEMPSRRRKWVTPAFALASVVIVVVVSAVILGTRHQPTTAPASRPVVPKTGMSGAVFLMGAGLSSSGAGIVSLEQQCSECAKTPARVRYWMLTTSDGGGSWKLSQRSYYLQGPVFAGRYGWAGGLQAAGGYGGVARYFETADGGLAWNVAPAAAPNEGGGQVSLGGGEVWAVGLSNQVAIENAPVTGSRLTATPTQPIRGDQTNVYVIAGGPGTAFASQGLGSDQLFVTHDDGRTWQHMAEPCARRVQPELLSAEDDTVWAECIASGSHIVGLSESDDSGRSWQALETPSSSLALRLQPVGGSVIWASTIGGVVSRSDDSGRTWKRVWDLKQAPIPQQVPSQRGGPYPPILAAQSANRASVFELISRRDARGKPERTNLVVYSTTDGGTSWQPRVVGLAGGG